MAVNMTAWDLVGMGVTTAAGVGTFTACTGYSGQTATIRNTDLGSKVNLEGFWTDGIQTTIARVRSPRLHDNVQGIRYNQPAASQLNLLGLAPQTPLVPQDTLIVEAAGAAADATGVYLNVSYASLPGSDGNYASWAQVKPRIVDIMTQEVQFAAAATANGWTAGTPLNTFTDLMKANTWYALLGYITSASVGAISLLGPDTGGLHVGGPGMANALETREWFRWQDEYGEEPGIPVINSANKAGTFVYVGSQGANYTGNVDLLFAELSGSTLPGA
jgi:hypothetical protein